MGLQCKFDKDVSDEENLVLVDIIFAQNHNLRERRPPDYSNDELVDPEAESNHVDQQVEKVAVNVLKTAFRWVEQGRQSRG